MTPDEIESALKAAFERCDLASCPLTDRQKQILLQLVEPNDSPHLDGFDDNPLEELTQEELDVFLNFVKTQEAQDSSWKAQLLNDWLHEEDSGEVHFIRHRYGVQWLHRLQRYHFEGLTVTDVLKVKLGDNIEVCNALWEWVQDNGPCHREWFPCVVIQIDDTSDGDNISSSCIVRFPNGAEYEIHGIYEWNRCNWRWKI